MLSIVFQDALTALNPVQPVGRQLAEPFRIHQGLSRRAARAEAIELMDAGGHPGAGARGHRSYPHQFSGGMRQRLLIAMAVALGPDVLLADEPTTALDVTVQAQIMTLLRDLQTRTGHGGRADHPRPGVVAEHADDVAVMYAGNVVETGPVREVFDHPRHPYTKGLLDSVPERRCTGAPLPRSRAARRSCRPCPSGCVFQARCPLARDAVPRTGRRCAVDRRRPGGRLPLLRGADRCLTAPLLDVRRPARRRFRVPRAAERQRRS